MNITFNFCSARCYLSLPTGPYTLKVQQPNPYTTVVVHLSYTDRQQVVRISAKALLSPMQRCVVSAYSAPRQAGLANIREEDLIMCCTKFSSITQAGSAVVFLFSPRATEKRTSSQLK